jgi:uncharacterized membrane protein
MTDPVFTPTPTPAKTSLGLEPNVAGALAYLLGFFTGIVLLLVEKENKFVRFHAMQSTITFGGFFVIYIVLMITVIGALLLLPLVLVQIVVWLLLMIKAFNGQMYKLPWVGEIAEKQIAKM